MDAHTKVMLAMFLFFLKKMKVSKSKFFNSDEYFDMIDDYDGYGGYCGYDGMMDFDDG